MQEISFFSVCAVWVSKWLPADMFASKHDFLPYRYSVKNNTPWSMFEITGQMIGLFYDESLLKNFYLN